MKRIFVALDGSSRAPVILGAARRLAELTTAQLVVYRAITASADIELAVREPEPVEDVLIRQAHDQLSQLTAELPRGMVEQLVVEFATAWDGICRAARERDADLIVIGSHGYSGIDHVLGTVAAKVVNHAACNVLVIRTPL